MSAREELAEMSAGRAPAGPAVAALEVVLDLHSLASFTGGCRECYDRDYPEPYPCDTVKAIEEALR